MARLETPILDKNIFAPDFHLFDPNNQSYSLTKCQGKKGLLVMFICNHCPYVQSVLDAIKEDTDTLLSHNIKSVAIMSNDTEQYPEDSTENMRHLSQKYQFNFPYLYDSTQQVAKDYGAVCTPDFFGFDEKLNLKYRGRIRSKNNEKELLSFMIKITKNQPTHSLKQYPSMGCSIKWK